MPTSKTPVPLVGISMGDPLGIGPEVVVKALAEQELRSGARFIVFGLSGSMEAAARAAELAPFWRTVRSGEPMDAPASAGGVTLIDYSDDPALAAERAGLTLDADASARATEAGGAASFRFVEDSISAAQGSLAGAPKLDAIVTAPINKYAWALAGQSRFAGHTELLSNRFGGPPTRMMFDSPRLRTILVTTHIGLAKVSEAITRKRVRETIEMGAAACRRLGVPSPRIAVCGVNPHASEDGLFGDEEARAITPAIEDARAAGIDASGPWPGDTIFTAAVKGKYDLVVAMYHDQGLIPVKLLAFDEAVNVTIGLPTVRTSPDHGTAYDIAGRNLANPGSMRAAISLAIRLAGSGR